MLRMSVGWHWHPVKDLSSVFSPTSSDANALSDAASGGFAVAPFVAGDCAVANADAAGSGGDSPDSADPPPSTPAFDTTPASSDAASASNFSPTFAPRGPHSSTQQLSAATSLHSSVSRACKDGTARDENRSSEAENERSAEVAQYSTGRDNSFLVEGCPPACTSRPLLDFMATKEKAADIRSSASSEWSDGSRKSDEQKQRQQHSVLAENQQGSRRHSGEHTKEKRHEDAALPPTASSSRKSSLSTQTNGCNHVGSTVCSIYESRRNTGRTSNCHSSNNTGRSACSSVVVSPSSLSSVSIQSSSRLNSSSSSKPSWSSWQTDPAVRKVLEKYREMNRVLSLVLPVGAFSLFRTLLQLSNHNFFCLIGDKGYPSADEFAGERDPHIAVHGSVSFMLNLHAIRLYFDCIGGFSMATPYRDTFQVTALWCCNGSSNGSDRDCEITHSESSRATCKNDMPRSQAAFLADAEDMPPDSLIQWQRSCQEREVGIKEALSLLRYSGHDPDVFLNLSSSIIKQCVQPFTNPRAEQDILLDLTKVHTNWFKLKKGEDLPDACAHVCMKLGQCKPAIHYLKASITQCAETLHASTYVNLAACHKVLRQFEEGIRCCRQALLLQPHYTQAQEMLSTLQMCQQPFRVALIGLGYWMRMEAVHLLRREKRVRIVAVYSYKEADALRFVSDSISNNEEDETQNEKIRVYAGAEGLKQLLQRKDIHAVVLDVHAQLTPWFLGRVLQARKHLLTRSPLALSLETGWKLVNTYKPYAADLVWHAVENVRSEEAFFQAKELLQQIGSLTSFSLHCVTQTLIPLAAGGAAPATAADFSTFPYSIKRDEAPADTREDRGTDDAEEREEEALQCSAVSHEKQASPAHDGDGCGAVAGSSAALGAFSSHAKRNHAQRKGSPLLTGWVELSDAQDGTKRIPGSFTVTNAAGDSSIKYTFLGTGGALELTRSVSSWKLRWTSEDSFCCQGAHSLAMQSIGHQNSHDAWLTDLFQAICTRKEAKKEHTVLSETHENWGLVDVTINAALADCAIIEAILGSIQGIISAYSEGTNEFTGN